MTRSLRTTLVAGLFVLRWLQPQLRAQSATAAAPTASPEPVFPHPFDGFDSNANGQISVILVQADGKILIGGEFTALSPNRGTAVTRNHVARLNLDGLVDMTFDPDADGNVYSLAVQADGKILVGGSFASIGGQMRSKMARLDASTGLADSFDPGADAVVDSIAIQPNGKVLVGGSFTNVGGQARNYLARLDPTSGLADSFNPSANASVLSLLVQTDGKILVGGFFNGTNSIGGATRNFIARLDPATALADSFDPNADLAVHSFGLQVDGKILAGGAFTRIGGEPRNRVARLEPATGLADSFNPGANDRVLAIGVQADGKILVGGGFTTIGGQARNHIARLDPETGLPDSLSPSPNASLVAIAIEPNGKILIGGGFTTLDGQDRNGIARLETDGTIDQTVDLDIGGYSVYASAVQPDGKFLIGGQFDSILNVPRQNLARLNPNGTVDLAFNPDPTGTLVNAITVQDDGKILVGGSFETAGGQPRIGMARLDATTGMADSFNPMLSGSPNLGVFSIVVQPDGKILVAGVFPNIGGAARNGIARLDPTTALADSFNPDANPPVAYAIALQADGKILVGGYFTSIGGQPRNHIARVDPTTGLPDSFDPNSNGSVSCIEVQPDGKILVAGDFSIIGGQTRYGVARLDPATGLADSFNVFLNQVLSSLVLQSDGKIFIGGLFFGVNGEDRPMIARLDPVTALPDSFRPIPDNAVGTISLQTDGKILAGGTFSTVGGEPRRSFARLSNDTAALQNLAATPTTITWTCGGSTPRFTRVVFAFSTDNRNYSFLGNGTADGANWTLTGLNLPMEENIYIRARGYYGSASGSGSIRETVRNVFIVPPTPTPTPTPTPCLACTPTPTPSPTPGSIPATILGNISTRLRVETGNNGLIGGFIVTGTEPKKVILRAIGPSLGVVGALTDPTLELRDSSGGLIASNDNWRSNQETEIIATGIPPANDLESAIVRTLPADGSTYTAIVRDANNGTGIGLVEVYDLDGTVDSKFANISTRGLVQTGDNAMIAGTIVLGQGSQPVLVRAIGPSLLLSGALADPALELRDSSGTVIRANDNWRSDQESEIIATGIPPTNDLESAIVATLPASGAAYTAIVRGVNDTTGVALVEVYALTN